MTIAIHFRRLASSTRLLMPALIAAICLTSVTSAPRAQPQPAATVLDFEDVGGEAFLTLMEVHGFVAVPAGKVLKIIPTTEARVELLRGTMMESLEQAP